MEKLKSCPFCGCNAVLVKHPYATYFPYYVRCDNFAKCAAVGVATVSCKTPEEAIKIWNHRPGEEDAYRRGVQRMPMEGDDKHGAT